MRIRNLRWNKDKSVEDLGAVIGTLLGLLALLLAFTFGACRIQDLIPVDN